MADMGQPGPKVSNRSGDVLESDVIGGWFMNRPGVFYVIVIALTIILGVIGMALYACGMR